MWTMGKRSRKRNRGAGKPPSTPDREARPLVHVRVALADMDLAAAAPLIKPAILYADKVTVYSPAATMLRHVHEFAGLSDPREQVLAMLEIARDVPTLRNQLGVDDATLESFKAFMSLDRRVVRLAEQQFGGAPEIESLYAGLDELSVQWRSEMPAAVASATDAVGGAELMTAVEAGAVTVADVVTHDSARVVAGALRAATGEEYRGMTDELVEGFVARTIETLGDSRSFPLLDADSSGLIRALEAQAGSRVRGTGSHGEEVAAAAQFMGFLPYFEELRMTEILELRSELREPLLRFRSAMARMSTTFGQTALDEGFASEVADAWRTDVEPALLDIRETLAEHGLLRETASVAFGDPRRLLVEAGGVFAAASTPAISLSHLMTAAVAAGITVSDVIGRAVVGRQAARRAARNHAFYFLHRVATESERNA